MTAQGGIVLQQKLTLSVCCYSCTQYDRSSRLRRVARRTTPEAQSAIHSLLLLLLCFRMLPRADSLSLSVPPLVDGRSVGRLFRSFTRLARSKRDGGALFPAEAPFYGAH